MGWFGEGGSEKSAVIAEIRYILVFYRLGDGPGKGR